MRKKIFIGAGVAIIAGVILAVGYARYSSHDGYTWIGDDHSLSITDIPYRMISVTDGGVEIAPNQKDFLNLTLALQGGQDQGKMVLFSAVDCYGPKVRDGLPSVMCKTADGATVDVASTDNVREILLALGRDHRRANIIGKAVGVYGSSTPMILVLDKNASRGE